MGESVAKISSKMLYNSTRDFNFIDAIFGRAATDWNPFALSMMLSTVKNISHAATGDDTLTRSLL